MPIKTKSLREKIVSCISCIPALFLSSLSAGFVTTTAYFVYAEGLNRRSLDLTLIGIVDLIGNVLALPGLLIFLTWSWKHWYAGQPSLFLYVTAGFFLAVLNGAGVGLILQSENNFAEKFLFVVLFFGVTGVLTAAIHWQIMRYWLSPAVTLFRESAKKELYSQF